MHNEGQYYRLVDGRHGRFLVNRNDTYVGRSLMEYGEWSEAEVSLFTRLLQPGDVVVEAGANLGSHTVALSKAVGDGGRVLAFEPQRLTHQLLCANLALNECFNVQARREAVGDVAGTLQVPFVHPAHHFNYGAVSLLSPLAGAPTEQVPLVRLDDVGFDRLDFIKADIEGFEPALLRGARQVIARHRPVVYLEISPLPEPRGNRDELIESMQSLGYRCFYYFTPIFNPHNHRGKSEDVFNSSSLDMLCVAPEKWSVSGLTEAQPMDEAFEVFNNGSAIRNACLPWSGAKISSLMP